ncbi:fimbrial protein [Serratia fonticola]|uniref:fimbrial protein n=1 Tax=Serratia fonticola TaxID=47917 RepID=UPI003AAEFB25
MSRAKYLLLLLLLGGLLPSAASAYINVDFGYVDLQGNILHAPCTIDTNSRDQSIDMGITPIGEIARNGRGVSKPFSIRLINCVMHRTESALSHGQYFEITFDGKRDGEFIGIEGEAEGIALQVSDELGNIAQPGVPLPSVMLASSEKTLNYSLHLVPNYQRFKSGEYRTTVRFKMDYY